MKQQFNDPEAGEAVLQPLIFAPTPLDEELLCSIVKRWESRMGSEPDFALRAFGRKKLFLDCVAACGSLTLQSTAGLLMSAEDVANNHTLRPMVRLMVRGEVIESVDAGKKRLMLLRYLGLNRQHCPWCIADQHAEFGICGLLRAHHLPGVCVCWKHGVRLLPGDAWVWSCSHKGWPRNVMRRPYPSDCQWERATARAQDFAVESNVLLKSPNGLDFGTTLATFKSLLFDRYGSARPARHKRLGDDCLARWGEPFIASIGLPLNPGKLGEAIWTGLVHGGGLLRPIEFVLAAVVLTGSVQGLLARASRNLRVELTHLEKTVRAPSFGQTDGSPWASRSEVAPSQRGTSPMFRRGAFALQRRRLRLSATQIGKILGVTGATIRNWETGKTKPGLSQSARVEELRKLRRPAALNLLKEQ
jgi:hypothetical protein